MNVEDIKRVQGDIASCPVEHKKQAQIGVGICFWLAEIALQLATHNEQERVKAERKKNQRVEQPTQSLARRSSENKLVYVEHWAINVAEGNIAQAGFTANKQKKIIAQLEINESTCGLLGTWKDARITRVQ